MTFCCSKKTPKLLQTSSCLKQIWVSSCAEDDFEWQALRWLLKDKVQERRDQAWRNHSLSFSPRCLLPWSATASAGLSSNLSCHRLSASHLRILSLSPSPPLAPPVHLFLLLPPLLLCLFQLPMHLCISLPSLLSSWPEGRWWTSSNLKCKKSDVMDCAPEIPAPARTLWDQEDEKRRGRWMKKKSRLFYLLSLMFWRAAYILTLLNL